MLCDKNCVKSDHKTRVSSSKLVGTRSNSRKLDQQKYVCKTRQYTLRNSQWGLSPSTVRPVGPRIGSPDYNWFKKSRSNRSNAIVGGEPLYIYIYIERDDMGVVGHTQKRKLPCHLQSEKNKKCITPVSFCKMPGNILHNIGPLQWHRTFAIVWAFQDAKHVPCKPHVRPHPNKASKQYHIPATRGCIKTRAICSEFDFSY